jgi:DNA replication licensing factor MCM3
VSSLSLSLRAPLIWYSISALQGGFKDAIERMVRLGDRRLIVNMDDLRDYDRELCNGQGVLFDFLSVLLLSDAQVRPNSLLKEPLSFLPAFDLALRDVVVSIADIAKYPGAKDAVYYIGLRGSFGDHHVNPRTLRANMLGKMISIEGIVTRCTSEHPPTV